MGDAGSAVYSGATTMIGQQISHFYIIRALGSGGMGVVYEAQDTRLPRSVAIKVLKPALARDVDAMRRFKREARLASSLNHPNICTVLDVDEGSGVSFIAMELLRGRTLRSRLADAPLPLDEMLVIGGQIADALAVAHEQGIIHRDITPGNVFLTDDGLVKLLDFGLAKHFPSIDGDGQATDDLTDVGVVLGTVHYMAPERLVDGAAVDYRCDLFSLGAMLYQMATGARPFDIQPRSALIAAIQDEPHVPVRRLAPQQPLALERIIDRLLAKQPDDRYQSARAVKTELDAIRPVVVPANVPHAGDAPVASIAVLPFVIVGDGDAEVQHFRDGLAHDLGAALSAMPTVRLASNTSTAALAGQRARDVGSALGAQLVLEGAIQRSGVRVRVTAHLVDAATEASVHPVVTVDESWRDALTTQRDVSQAIVVQLAPVVGSTGRSPAMKRHEPDPDAFHALKRGLHHWRGCFSGGWRPAIEHLQYAIEKDPQYSVAHVALANAYNFLGFYSLIKPVLAFDVAARSAKRALALDGTLAAAHRELALATFGGEWDWDRSEAHFRRAIALDDTDALAHVHYSWLLILLGREDAALSEAQRAQALAPSSRLVAAARAQTLYIARRFDEAIAACTHCLAGDATYVFALHLRGLCYLASGQAAATADLEQAATASGRAPFYLALLGRCYGEFGMRERALALIEELNVRSRDAYIPPQCFVFIYAGLGNPARALEYQERAYQDGSSPFNYLSPSMRELYALDPYHKKRLEQMRLAL
jgi:TolB-like protein/tRNA A-37 threonylcarbamoyl transferase component Bud32/tetratricopeptide (TPR) repeat protein